MSELEIIQDYSDEKLSQFLYNNGRRLEVISEGNINPSPRMLALYDNGNVISTVVDWPGGLISQPESGFWADKNSGVSQVRLSNYLSPAIDRAFNYRKERDKRMEEGQEGKGLRKFDPKWRRKRWIYRTLEEVKEREVLEKLRDSNYPSLEEMPPIYLTVFDIVKQL